MKRRRLIVREFPVHENLFSRCITFMYGERDDIGRALFKATGHDKDLPPNCLGRYRLHEHDGYEADFICIVRRRSRAQELPVLAHETLHFVGHALRSVGIEHTDATEEIYCYYQQWVIHRCLVVMGQA